MSKYGQYCPITRSLEVLGDRWTLLVIRDLLLGATRFNELARGLPRCSRGLLSKRLAQLERNGLVTRDDEGGYVPTQSCEELRELVFGLAEWGARWAFGEPRPDELDPTVLMWWIRGGINPEPFARKRVVLHIQMPGSDPGRFWFVIQPDDVSLCFTDPGFPVDVTIECPLGVLYQIWEARIELETAVRDGIAQLYGSRDLVLRLPAALRLSPVAPIVRRVTVAATAV